MLSRVARLTTTSIWADAFEPPFRLNCEELTGQTNRIDRRLRQRRFQEVFMDDEVEAASGVDLLSVTTTMEAGVDIGALQAIALANMPPVDSTISNGLVVQDVEGSGCLRP